jgi:hypothetical protein
MPKHDDIYHQLTVGDGLARPRRLSRRLFLGATLALGLLTSSPLGSAPLARASDEDNDGNRFGPPWVGIIDVDGATLYSEPSVKSEAKWLAPRGILIPVLSIAWGGETPGGGTRWYRTPEGFLPSTMAHEYREPWVAETTRSNVPVYAKAETASGIRRSARQGELFRVTGMSPDLADGSNVWWATTEGFLPLSGLRLSADQFALDWTMPAPDEAPGGWWATVVREANVRVAATTKSPIVGQLTPGRTVKVLSDDIGENVQGSDLWHRIDGGRYAGARVHSSLVRRMAAPKPSEARPGRMPPDQTWITVDRARHTLTLVKNGTPDLVTYVALGRAGVETPSGQYATYGKFRYDDMTSTSVPNPTAPYDFPNVPFVQYYKEGGFAIHGTYWHDSYNSLESQGCINLTVTDGMYLFQQTRPENDDGTNEVWANGPATPVLILD